MPEKKRNTKLAGSNQYNMLPIKKKKVAICKIGRFHAV
jgi:hypothetical protein